MTSLRLSIVAAAAPALCLLTPSARSQSGRPVSPAAHATVMTAVPRGCPAPTGVARAVSPGDVSLTAAGGSSALPLGNESRTVFYASRAAAPAVDTGGRLASSTVKKASTVRTRSAGDITAVRAGSASAKHLPPRARTAVRRRRVWTVQVAAYETLDEALALQELLCGRGFEARVLGAGRPYDVRVGRFATSDSALAMARRLTSRQLTVFVTPE